MSEISVRVLSKDYTAAGDGAVREYAGWSNLTITPGAAGYIEWKVTLPTAGKWQLHALMTALEKRPCTLVINGVKQSASILGELTGGWNVDTLKWFVYGPYEFKQGENVFRIEFPGAIPHLKEFGFSLVEAAVQEPTKPPAQSISGIVNVSAAVTSIAGETLTLGGTTNPLKAGDRVVIIQMAGAYIDTSDNERFGTITSDNGAGRYVWATVVGTNGQNVKLAESFGGFDTATGKVQVVRAYSSAGDVTVAGRMDVPAWDGSSGGVIVIESGGALKIAAEVDVSGKGFKGGRVSHNNAGGTARGYVYAESNLAGIKGEGIAAVSGDRAGGRGAPANAGGGGNEHNSGGGGGGNGGAGGRGGFEYYSQTGDTNGIGGRNLDYPDRVFFGGGGGGGQQNNGQGTGGGAGGGLVLLRAQSIAGSSGAAIRANGANGPDAGWDGAGGGGAGGTIVLDAASVTGEFILEARGGKGGATPWGQGEGGGGGGGTIRTNAALPSTIKVSLGGGDPGRTGAGAGATTGAQGIVGPLVPSKPGSPSGTGTSSANCDKVREELEKKLAERDQKCAAYEQKLDTIEKKLDTIEKKLAEQERSNIDQERRLLEQDRKIATQEKSNLEQERKLLEQDKKLAEQERSNLEQERKLLAQDRKIADVLEAMVAKCGACDEKLGTQARTIDDLTKKLADIEAKATKCSTCEEKLGAQTKTIEDLTAKLDDLTRKLAELTSKPEPKPEAPPPPPAKADDLEAIEGIGPKIADLLKNAGIRTYKDLAAIDVAELKKILKGRRYAIRQKRSVELAQAGAAHHCWRQGRAQGAPRQAARWARHRLTSRDRRTAGTAARTVVPGSAVLRNITLLIHDLRYDTSQTIYGSCA